MNCVAPIEKKSIRFRARSFVAFALTPEAPLDDWLEGLDRWIDNSPGYFKGRPVILDLSLLRPEAEAIGELVGQLAAREIRVYAIEAEGIEALEPHLPPLLTGAREATVEGLLPRVEAGADEEEPAPVEDRRTGETLTVHSPVRSGQSIIHLAGDVIVLGHVASGSEIVAGGSIHVYGTLRGSAFAGAEGNEKARIFCRRNEAELVAINGWYRTAEDMEASSRGIPAQAYLDNGALWVAPIK